MPDPGGDSPGGLLVSAPFPLTLRNFLATGLVTELADRFGFRVTCVSPYRQAEFSSGLGRSYPNHPVRSEPGPWGVPNVAGVTLLDRAFRSVHLNGFSLEYPDASLLTLDLSQ